MFVKKIDCKTKTIYLKLLINLKLTKDLYIFKFLLSETNKNQAAEIENFPYESTNF